MFHHPHITRQLSNEVMRVLTDMVSGAMSTLSSYYGGGGSNGLGALRLVRLVIYQEPITISIKK
jgi:hypothetical protein